MGENTRQGFLECLQANLDYLFKTLPENKLFKNRSSLSLKAVTTLYKHQLTKILKDAPSMGEIRGRLLGLGQSLITNFSAARSKVVRFSLQIFKTDDVF